MQFYVVMRHIKTPSEIIDKMVMELKQDAYDVSDELFGFNPTISL